MNHDIKTNSIDFKQCPVGLSTSIFVIADISVNTKLQHDIE